MTVPHPDHARPKQMKTEVVLSLNGSTVTGLVEPRTHLADFIREEALATGTHLGCEQGVCGACTVFVDGEPMRSCITLAAACDTADVRTVEGFADDPLMQAIRTSFKQHHGLQCGYCTPGMLATAYDIVRRLPHADRRTIRRELSGNLCRCTGYEGIVNAIEAVLKDPPPASLVPMARSKPRSASPSQPASIDRRDMDGTEAANAQLPGISSLPDPASFGNAVTLEKTLTLAARPDAVWQIVSDPEAMVSCIPGASLTAPLENGIAQGACDVMVGPMRAQFIGTARIDYRPDDKAGMLVGKGRDGLSRSTLEGRLDFKLVPAEAGTDLKLDMRYRLNGPLSQFGRPALVEEIANSLLQDIAAALEARITGRHGAVQGAQAPRPIGGFRLLFLAFGGLIKRILSGKR